MEDRAPTYPGRVLVTPEAGAPYYAVVTRADEPTQTGDPLNKRTLLQDATAAAYGLDSLAVPDDVLNKASKAAVLTYTTVDYSPKEISCPTTPQSIYCFCYGDGKLIAAGNAGNILYSENGINWSSYTCADVSNYSGLFSVVYGTGMFFGRSSEKNNKIYYSADGKYWSTSPLPVSALWNQIIYGNGKFVLQGTVGNAQIAYASEDGFVWKQASFPVPNYNSIYDSAYGNGKFVMVGYAGALAYSDDGLTWTFGEMPITTMAWNSVAYGNGRFVSVGYTPGNDSVCSAAYSEDGVHWTATRLPDSTKRWYRITYGDGFFYAKTNANRVFAFSRDGVVWNERLNGLGVTDYNRPVFAFERFYEGGFNGKIFAAEPVKTNVLTDYFEHILQYHRPGEAKIATGSYTGTGSYGSGNPNKLSFDFTPKLVIVVRADQAGYLTVSQPGFSNIFGGSGFIVPCGTTRYLAVQDPNSYMNVTGLRFSWSSLGVSWYADRDYSESQLNASGALYLWVAFG